MNGSRRQFLIGAGGCWLAATVGSALVGAANGAPTVAAGAVDAIAAVPDQPGIDLAGHVLNRCSFGIAPGDRAALLRLAPAPAAAVDAWLERQLRPDAIADDDAEHAVRGIESVAEPLGELYEYKEHILRRDLVRATVLRALHSRRQLHEVMVEFWTDHFNIDISKAECAWLKVADDREVIRRHALGDFRALLRASALSPAMLWYLDGRANRRASADERPNENYARELMELHTLGVHGGYSQQDVMEVARCLTGWTVRDRHHFLKGRVEFHHDQHDDGAKTVLGTRIPAGLGAGDLDRVLDLVAGHPATARHLASKLCRRFIADAPPESAVSGVAAAFTASRGDLRATLRALFARAEFRGEDGEAGGVRGGKLKRPFHYLVSALRATGAATDAGPALVEYLHRLGQAPFQFPTPDGYPQEATAWRDTLLWRWNLAAALAANRIHGTRIERAALEARMGGNERTLAHLLGRQPNAVERQAIARVHGAEHALALTLASPAFQRC